MNQKCKCACHDNVLTKPYDHDTQCCDDMNGFLVISESEANKILSAPSIEEKIQDFIFRFGHGGTNQEGVFEPHENTKRASIWLRTAFQDVYSQVEKQLVEEINLLAADKASVLKNNGYGNVPILFEKEEILALINKKPTKDE